MNISENQTKNLLIIQLDEIKKRNQKQAKFQLAPDYQKPSAIIHPNFNTPNYKIISIFQKYPWSWFEAPKNSYLNSKINDLKLEHLNSDINALKNDLFEDFQIELLTFGELGIAPPEIVDVFDVANKGRIPDLLKITLVINFKGDINLLEISPVLRGSSRILLGNDFQMRVENDNKQLIYDIFEIDHGNENEMDSFAKGVFAWVSKTCYSINDLANSYNLGLKSRIEAMVNKRLDELNRKKRVIEKFSFPIIKQQDLPDLLTIQISKKTEKFSQVFDDTSNEKNKIAYLKKELYDNIINDLYIIGQQMEKTPSVYKNKVEEDLRDLFWLLLEFNYSTIGLSTTGETFNHSGKTDLLIKYKNQNIFVAELKMWNGIGSAHDAINQLFAYLTWNDDKVALIFFIKNKSPESAISSFLASVKEHVFFERTVKNNRSIIEFEFKHPHSQETLVILTVLFFHFPK